MTSNNNNITSVSAPGKVLLAGGYLVLETPNCGIVLATTSRFHATICRRPSLKRPYDTLPVHFQNDTSSISIPVDVYSPQFHCTFSYWLIIMNERSDLVLHPSEPDRTNPFIEKSLIVTFAFILQVIGYEKFVELLKGHELEAIAIKLRADNDFYSQIRYLRERNMDLTLENIQSLPPFLPCPLDPYTQKPIIHKTGLGSSAALVTALVSSMLAYFQIVNLTTADEHACPNNTCTRRDLEICHNLAQLCHSYAQGKIGSGFDVSGAIYGTHMYTRFNQSIISTVMNSLETCTKEACSLCIPQSVAQLVHDCIVCKRWDSTVEPFQLPPNMDILLADVCGGSESPSMARKVLAWKNQKMNSIPCDTIIEPCPWETLAKANENLRHLFLSLYSDSKKKDTIDHDASSEETVNNGLHSLSLENQLQKQKLQEIRHYIKICRENLKRMGLLAGVDIEPIFQTRLADECMKLPGVVAAGVPGAGGHDALYVLYIRDGSTIDESDSTRENIVQYWSQWCVDFRNDCGVDISLCPLNSRSLVTQGIYGLHQTKLGW